MLAFPNDARMVDSHLNVGRYTARGQAMNQSIQFYDDLPSDVEIHCPQDYQQQLPMPELRHQQQPYSNASAQSSTTSSPVDGDFVIPSQTFDGDFVIPSQTFHDDFSSLQPQMHIILDFESYDSPATSFGPETSDYSDNSVYCTPTSGSSNPSRWMQSYNMAESSPTIATSFSQPIRQPNFDLRSTSAALQRMQISSFGHGDTGARKTKKEIKREQREMCKGINASIQKEAEERCNWKGCKAKFHRREHLKRHQKCHMRLPPQFFCNFCDKPRAFSRTDNLKSHVKLHIKHRASARTPYHPDALAFYEGLSCKVRKNKTVSESNRHAKQEEKRESPFAGTRSRASL